MDFDAPMDFFCECLLTPSTATITLDDPQALLSWRIIVCCSWAPICSSCLPYLSLWLVS